MSDSVFLGRSVAGYETTPALRPYDKVILNIDDETYFEAGDGDNVLELTSPWGSQQVADDILASLKDYSYQPYDTDWAKLNPAAELGDGVTINGVFSGIFANETKFSTLMAAHITAPQDKAVDHEYPYMSRTNRETTRKFSETRAALRVNAASIEAEVTSRKAGEAEMRALLAVHETEIKARVTRIGGDGKSFGWTLTEDGFILSSGSREVFRADDKGVSVTGKITATSGYIGNGSQGFTIKPNAIYNGLENLSGNTNGIYIGTDGISLGGGRFKVDSNGNLYATNGTFTGYVYANRIQVGGDAGFITGGQVGNGTISTYNTNGYLNGGVANGYYAGDVFSGAAIANCCQANLISAPQGGLRWGGYPVVRRGRTIRDGDFVYALDIPL